MNPTVPDEYKDVSADRLESNNRAVILRESGGRTRLYMLSPDADGKSGVLY